MPDSTFSAGPVHHPKARPSASAAPALRGAPGFQVLLVTREPWVFRSRLSCFSTTRRRVSQIGSASPKPSPCCALTPRQHFLRSMKAALTPPTYDQPSAVDFAQPRLVGVRSLTHARNERALSTTLDGRRRNTPVSVIDHLEGSLVTAMITGRPRPRRGRA